MMICCLPSRAIAAHATVALAHTRALLNEMSGREWRHLLASVNTKRGNLLFPEAKSLFGAYLYIYLFIYISVLHLSVVWVVR